MLPSKKNSIKECDTNSDNNSGSPDSELDSGISINGHYDQIERLRKNGLDYERIDEIKTMTGKVSKDLFEMNQTNFISIFCLIKLLIYNQIFSWFLHVSTYPC